MSDLHLTTNADLLTRINDALATVADEHRAQWDEDGLHIATVDPANVLMLDLTTPASAFGSYDPSGVERGWLTNTLESALSHTRVGYQNSHGDEVTMGMKHRETVIHTTADDRMSRTKTFYTPPTDAIREAPDIPEFNQWVELEVDTLDFRDAITALDDDGRAEYAAFTATDFDTEGVSDTATGNATIGAQGDDWADRFSATNAAQWTNDDRDPTTATSVISLNYLSDVAQALREVKCETALIRWREEHPITVVFSESDFGITGEFRIAPRIISDDEATPYTVSLPEWVSDLTTEDSEGDA